MNATKIVRNGNTFDFGDGLTATLATGGLPELRFWRDGQMVKSYRGSSLCFGDPLSDEDRDYLAHLAGKIEAREAITS